MVILKVDRSRYVELHKTRKRSAHLGPSNSIDDSRFSVSLFKNHLKEENIDFRSKGKDNLLDLVTATTYL